MSFKGLRKYSVRHPAMDESVGVFLEKLTPYDGIWTHVVISTAAIRLNDEFISICSRLTLRSEKEPPHEIHQQIAGLFLASRFSMEAQEFPEYLKGAVRDARLKLPNNGSFVSLLVPRLNAHDSEPRFSFFAVNESLHPEHQLRAYSQKIELLAHCGAKYKIPNYRERLEEVEKGLRARTDYSGTRALFADLWLDSNPSSNETTFSAVAPFPFGISYSAGEIRCEVPDPTVGGYQLKLFFDSRQVETHSLAEPHTTVDVRWPNTSKSAQVYLYYNGAEVGSITMNRYSGTQEWRLEVDGYFDEDGNLLKAGLAERKNTDLFEQSVSRLLTLLGLPCVWYGDKRFHERPDLAAAFEIEQNRIVLIGECVGQKPSTKFTPLLHRVDEIRQQLDKDVLIIPVVFTNSDVSEADQTQARADGLGLIGRSELETLLSLIGEPHSSERAVNLFKSLTIAEDGGFPIRWPS